MKNILLAAALAALLLPGMPLRADSLWTESSSSLFADNKARRVGDVLTIVISEQTRAVAQASTKADKSESATFGPGTGFLLGQLKRLGIAGSTDISASGQTNRSGSLTGRISVTVKSVDANGNLLVEGIREVQVNAEKQKMLFTGRVRPADISPENTVGSASVADATITYEGKGPVGNKQREGIITKIFKILF